MIGELVRQRREAKGWTQTELAEKAGLRQVYVSQVEGGDIKVPRDHNLDKLGKVLGVTRAEFYRAAGMFDGLPTEVMPPQPPDEDATGDTPFTPAMIVAYVESHPDPRFRADLAEEAEYMSPEDYEQYCANIFRAWSANGDLAKRTARLMRGRRDVTK